MKIIWAIIKTGLLTPVMGICSFVMLALLFNDVMKMNLFEMIILLLFSGVVAAFATILIFVPMAVGCKNTDWGGIDRIVNCLPVAVIPLALAVGSILYYKPSVFIKAEFLLVFLHCIISYYTSFLIFFSSFSNKKS